MITDDTIPSTIPLVEEEDAPRYEPVAANDPLHRRLRGIAGADNGYIFVVVPADETRQVSIDYAGFDPESIPAGLRELATMFEDNL